MNIKSTLLILSLFALASCGSRKNFLETKQTNSSITVDGNSEEWISSGAMLVNGKIRYAFRNSPEYLYVLIEADDQQDIMQITRAGLNIRWNNAGKKKKKHMQGIRFPMMSPDEQFYNQQMGNSGSRLAGMPGSRDANRMTNIPMVFDYIALLDFDEVDEQQVRVETANELYGIELTAKFDSNNILVVEYKIPKKVIFGSKKQEKLAFLFETEEMEKLQMMGGGQGGPPSGGGMGGPPGGGMGGSPPAGGGRPGGGPGVAQSTQAAGISFWQFLHLSE